MPLSPPHGTAVGASTCGTAPLASRPLKLAGTARVRGDATVLVLDSERRQQRRAMCPRVLQSTAVPAARRRLRPECCVRMLRLSDDLRAAARVHIYENIVLDGMRTGTVY